MITTALLMEKPMVLSIYLYAVLALRLSTRD